MRTTIDRAGRIVVPKALRDAVGLQPDEPIEISEIDGRLVIDRPPVPKRVVETPDGPVLTADRALPPLDPVAVRRTLEQIRR